MKKFVLAACLALSFALPSAHAQSATPVDPDSAAAVKELLIAMNYRDTMRQTFEQVQKNLPAIMLQGASAAIKNNKALTEAQKNEAMAKASREIPQAAVAMGAIFNDPALMEELVAEFVPLYARHFTAVEIRQLAAFYKTPVGTKMMALTPQISGEAMQISQRIMSPRVSAAIEKVLKAQ
ncbi:MAG: DUF2059 domain-containing protein [Massilia sp.]|nr:DUF2059 domain-containing protein [Massilia sp.]